MAVAQPARAGSFRLAISPAIAVEVKTVLRLKFQWHEQQVAEAITSLSSFTQLVEPAEKLRVIRDDPDDDRILECAVTSGSHFIVSGDKHLLQLGVYQGIQIVTPSAFMALVPQSPQ